MPRNTPEQNEISKAKARVRARERNALNPKKKRESWRRWAAKNKQAIAERVRSYREENAEKFRELEKKRVGEESRARCRAYYAANKEKRNADAREWRKANPDKVRAHCRKRRARLAAAGGSHTIEDVNQILAAQKSRCAACSKSVRSKYEVDHIVPLSKGGSDHRRNLQILCGLCNRKKKNVDPEIFYRRLGKLI